MKYAQSNHSSNIAWTLVSGIHGLLVWGTVAAVVGFIGMILMEALRSEPYISIEPEQKPMDPAVLAERQRLYDEKLRVEEEERKRLEELRQQAEIQRKKLIEEERRSRTAEKAARSALDDF
jgi:hypothetical protein